MSPPWSGSAKRLGLRIDAHTLRGTLQGVPRLTETLSRHGAGATILFNLGPDYSGRAFRHLLHEHALRRAAGTNLLRRYGLRALLGGSLMPAANIGARCADVMRSARDAGFEVGLSGWDAVHWRAKIGTADGQWTHDQMQTAMERFEQVFGSPARVHGAPGWQINTHSLRLSQRLGFDYCADTRGTQPFVPVWNAEIIACPQVPTTLPTFAELIGTGEATAATVVRHLLDLAARTAAPAGHVISVQADLEGMSLIEQFEDGVRQCKQDGIEILSLGAYLEAAGATDLPRHCVDCGELPGQTHTQARQGVEFLA